MGLTLMFCNIQNPLATICIVRADLIGSTSADLSAVCDILLSLLALPTRSKVVVRTDHLSRAIYKLTDHKLLWSHLYASANFEPQIKSLIPSGPNAPATSLFHLAIDHMIKMITSSTL